jgi:hypothetical protein
MFIHHVYFWLKPEAPATAAAELTADCRTMLSTIPGVKQLYAGRPAMTPREVVDNSYSVGLSIVFEDSAGHDVYQDHPIHHDFITRNKANWERVRIFDFLG